ncbi:hypothetical protein BH11MYX2_BH11MYX2_00620 [soil metagenome]
MASAQLDHFDDVLRGFVTTERRRCSLAVFETIEELLEQIPTEQKLDFFLFERLLSLILDTHELEGRTEPEGHEECDAEVRSLPHVSASLWRWSLGVPFLADALSRCFRGSAVSGVSLLDISSLCI